MPLCQYFSGRKILIAKEITKIHEIFFREKVENLKNFKNDFKGELTVVISNKDSNLENYDKEKIVNKARKYLKKYTLKDTVEIIFEIEKINKKIIYDICLKIKDEKNN